MPGDVLKRAQEILHALERGDSGRRAKTVVDELPLFASAAPTMAPVAETKLQSRVRAINVDELSPRDALQLLYELKDLAKD